MGRNLIITQMERPICVKCHANQSKINGKTKNGFIKYSKYCMSCERALYNQKNLSKRTYGYVLNKKNYCEKCGFIPEHSCQLDVDHIDGNCINNKLENLQTLCANCHRLKTHNERNKKRDI